jgi:diacylglycerol O-acyltransferase / wax synthase
MVMHDLTRDAEPTAPPASPWQPRPIPDALTQMQNAVRDVLTEQAVAWTDEQFLVFRPAKAAERQQLINSAMASAAPYALQPAPPTPFNGPVSARREYAWAEIPFAEVRGIRSALGGTVNDVVLAVVSGALRRYLQAKGYPVDGVELRAMCPVSMRRPEEQGALGNLVSSMIAPLYVGIADPVERLQAEREAMDRLKQQGQAAGFYAMTELSRNIPAWVQAFAAQGEVQNTVVNTVSTNVPGPQIPLFLGGREMLHMYGMGILSAGIGLFIAIGTYNRALAFGLLVDSLLLPDPWFVAECFQEAFAELRGAAEKVAPPATVRQSATGNRQSGTRQTVSSTR